MLTPKPPAKNGGLHLVPVRTAPNLSTNSEERFLIDAIASNRSRLRLLRATEADLWGHVDPAKPTFAKVMQTLAQLLTVIHSSQSNYIRALQALQRLQTPQAKPSKATSTKPVGSSGKRRRRSALAPIPPEAA